MQCLCQVSVVFVDVYVEGGVSVLVVIGIWMTLVKNRILWTLTEQIFSRIKRKLCA